MSRTGDDDDEDRDARGAFGAFGASVGGARRAFGLLCARARSSLNAQSQSVLPSSAAGSPAAIRASSLWSPRLTRTNTSGSMGCSPGAFASNVSRASHMRIKLWLFSAGRAASSPSSICTPAMRLMSGRMSGLRGGSRGAKGSSLGLGDVVDDGYMRREFSSEDNGNSDLVDGGDRSRSPPTGVFGLELRGVTIHRRLRCARKESPLARTKRVFNLPIIWISRPFTMSSRRVTDVSGKDALSRELIVKGLEIQIIGRLKTRSLLVKGDSLRAHLNLL